MNKFANQGGDHDVQASNYTLASLPNNKKRWWRLIYIPLPFTPLIFGRTFKQDPKNWEK